jgi:hypothetical protein
MPHNTTPEEQAELVRDWLGRQEHYDSELPGIEVEATDGGVVIHLKDELDLSRFNEGVHGVEVENPQVDEAYLEVRDCKGEEIEEIKSEDTAYVYEVQDLGNGTLAQFKVGRTYRRTDTISLGPDPMWPEGDPTDDVVEQTLFHLSHYLAAKYNG